jgi:formylglycine-generating enzyme required for sulfatase activity
VNVSWFTASLFCRWLESRLAGLCAAVTALAGMNRARLPTEAEWEYAARGRSTSDYWWGNRSGELQYFGWFVANRRRRLHPVAIQRGWPEGRGGLAGANDFGLFDVHGGVWEWCADWFGEHGPGGATVEDPSGPGSGSARVARGGSWDVPKHGCRSACRGAYHPADSSVDLGFRVVLSSAPSRARGG